MSTERVADFVNADEAEVGVAAELSSSVDRHVETTPGRLDEENP